VLAFVGCAGRASFSAGNAVGFVLMEAWFLLLAWKGGGRARIATG
jgi:hypothetical protein